MKNFNFRVCTAATLKFFYTRLIVANLNSMCDIMSSFDDENIFGKGEFNEMFDEYFTGKSFLNPLVDMEDNLLFVANVTFEPGCRNNWHIHHAKNGGGQLLICVAGKGFYQEEGSEVQELKPGVVVEIPPNVKHWHGAQKDSWFSHISVEVPGEETSNEWLEPVSDEYYNQL